MELPHYFSIYIHTLYWPGAALLLELAISWKNLCWMNPWLAQIKTFVTSLLPWNQRYKYGASNYLSRYFRFGSFACCQLYLWSRSVLSRKTRCRSRGVYGDHNCPRSSALRIIARGPMISICRARAWRYSPERVRASSLFSTLISRYANLKSSTYAATCVVLRG